MPEHRVALVGGLQRLPLVRRARSAVFWVRYMRVREELARRHLRGEGLEIGPLHNPLRVPASVRVRYVDAWTGDELRAQYPELAAERIVEADIVDDGTRLESVADGSQDFVIASHFLEHTEDPIGALATMLRVTRPGGIVYLAVPDKRHTFDRARPLTTLEHLRRDHEDGGEGSRAAHYAEWGRLVGGVADEDLAAYVEHHLRERPHIHFHVWMHGSLLAFLNAVDDDLGFNLVEARSHRHETIVLLRRRQVR